MTKQEALMTAMQLIGASPSGLNYTPEGILELADRILTWEQEEPKVGQPA